MPDVQLVAIQDSDAGLVAKRAAEVGSPPTFTDYRKMLETTRPNFVVALGRHRQMAGIAHDLLDLGYPFLMENAASLYWSSGIRLSNRSVNVDEIGACGVDNKAEHSV
jgi:hypothetical protein